jgi:hypothetical protein
VVLEETFSSSGDLLQLFLVESFLRAGGERNTKKLPWLPCFGHQWENDYFSETTAAMATHATKVAMIWFLKNQFFPFLYLTTATKKLSSTHTIT